MINITVIIITHDEFFYGVSSSLFFFLSSDLCSHQNHKLIQKELRESNKIHTLAMNPLTQLGPPIPIPASPKAVKAKGKKRCSAKATENRKAKAWRKFLRNVQDKRRGAIDGRLENVQTRLLPAGGVLMPEVFADPERWLTSARRSSPQTREFYLEHPLRNKLLLLSEGPNVSNPEGVPGKGKGVFAACDLPADTRLCPYLGKRQSRPCSATEQCQYDLLMYKGCVACAREVLYDTGYLIVADEASLGHGIKAACPSPPNYGRYFNTLFDERADCEFNCVFEIVDDGCDAMFIHTSRAVKAGEELLIDYGGHFLQIE